MRSRAAIAPFAGCVVLMTACGGIPMASAPESAERLSQEDSQPRVRGNRPGPAEGDSPEQIVDKFLGAMDVYEEYALPDGSASEFLTDEAVADWEPLIEPPSEIRVYSGEPDIAVDGDVVTLSLNVESTYDRLDGFKRYPASADPVIVELPLAQVDGEWRIAAAPNGLLIESEQFEAEFDSYNLYFYNKSFDSAALAPDPVYLPLAAENKGTLLTQQLLEGPSRWLAPAVETAFPEDTILEPESVPVSDGTARITLSAAAVERPDRIPTSAEARSRMVEQLAWTLGELRDVERVEVTSSDGRRLSGTDEDPTLDVPEGSPTGLSTRVYAVTNAGLSWVAEGASPALVPVAGPLGSRPDLREAAVDRQHFSAAAVTTSGEIIQADLSTDGEVTTLLDEDLVYDSLEWDGHGLLWAIDRLADDGADTAGAEEETKGDAGSRLLVIDPVTGGAIPVTPSTPGGADIEQFAIAPDGVRIVLVIDGAAYLAIIERDPEKPQDPSTIELGDLRVLHLDNLSEPLGDVAWYADDELALLTAPEPPTSEEVGLESGETQQLATPAPKIRLASLDELVARQADPMPDGVTIAAPSVDNRLTVGTSDGESTSIWMRSRTGRWVTLEGASAPAYAG